MKFYLLIFVINFTTGDLRARIINNLKDPVFLNSIADLLLARFENKSIRSEIATIRFDSMAYRGKTWRSVRSDNLETCESTCKDRV